MKAGTRRACRLRDVAWVTKEILKSDMTMESIWPRKLGRKTTSPSF
jgi:hypothetical protein